MSTQREIPSNLRLFAGLTPEELQVVAARVDWTEREPGTVLFREGDAGDSLFLVVAGAVEVTTRIAENVETTLLTLRAGGVFGELALVTGEARSGTAKVTEKATLVALRTDAFAQVVQEHPGIGVKVMKALLAIVGSRLNTTTEMYRRVMAWDLSVSGLAEMTFGRLMTQPAELVFDLTTGRTLRGQLLKMEKGPVGYELLVRSAEGRLVIIPYHALAAVSMPAGPDSVQKP